jgi:hypothetical protein
MRPLSLSDFPVPNDGYVFLYSAKTGKLAGWLPADNPELGELQKGMIVW